MSFPRSEGLRELGGRIGSAWAIVGRDYRIIRSYRLAFALDFVFGLANLVIYYYISQTVGDAGADKLGGAPSYFAFAAVGVALMVVIQTASVGLARRVREEQLTGTLEMLLAEPVAAPELSLGLAGFPFLFAMFRGVFYLFVAYALLGLGLPDADLLGFAVVFALTGLAIVAIGVLIGALVVTFKRGETLAPLATFLLGLAGGAYFPTGELPGFLQPVVDVMPTHFAFDGLRNALFLGGDWGSDAVGLLIFSVVALPLSVLCFDLSLRHARARGTVAQY